jgi:hypothetical protein
VNSSNEEEEEADKENCVEKEQLLVRVFTSVFTFYFNYKKEIYLHGLSN